jgi:hypothetical protein
VGTKLLSAGVRNCTACVCTPQQPQPLELATTCFHRCSNHRVPYHERRFARFRRVRHARASLLVFDFVIGRAKAGARAALAHTRAHRFGATEHTRALHALGPLLAATHTLTLHRRAALHMANTAARAAARAAAGASAGAAATRAAATRPAGPTARAAGAAARTATAGAATARAATARTSRAAAAGTCSDEFESTNKQKTITDQRLSDGRSRMKERSPPPDPPALITERAHSICCRSEQHSIRVRRERVLTAAEAATTAAAATTTTTAAAATAGAATDCAACSHEAGTYAIMRRVGSTAEGRTHQIHPNRRSRRRCRSNHLSMQDAR